MQKKTKRLIIACSILLILAIGLYFGNEYLRIGADSKSPVLKVISTSPLNNSYTYPANSRTPIEIVYNGNIQKIITKEDILLRGNQSGSNVDSLPFDISYSKYWNNQQSLIIKPLLNMSEAQVVNVSVNPRRTLLAEPFALKFIATNSYAPSLFSFKQDTTGLNFSFKESAKYALRLIADNGTNFLLSEGVAASGLTTSINYSSFVQMVIEGYGPNNIYPQEHSASNFDSGVYTADLSLVNSSGSKNKKIKVYHFRPFNSIAYDIRTGELLSVLPLKAYNGAVLSSKQINLFVSNSNSQLSTYTVQTDEAGLFRIRIFKDSAPKDITEIRAFGYMKTQDLFPSVVIDPGFVGTETMVFNNYWPLKNDL